MVIYIKIQVFYYLSKNRKNNKTSKSSRSFKYFDALLFYKFIIISVSFMYIILLLILILINLRRRLNIMLFLLHPVFLSIMRRWEVLILSGFSCHWYSLPSSLRSRLTLLFSLISLSHYQMHTVVSMYSMPSDFQYIFGPLYRPTSCFLQ